MYDKDKMWFTDMEETNTLVVQIYTMLWVWVVWTLYAYLIEYQGQGVDEQTYTIENIFSTSDRLHKLATH